jgi:hypothetical protein
MRTCEGHFKRCRHCEAVKVGRSNPKNGFGTSDAIPLGPNGLLRFARNFGFAALAMTTVTVIARSGRDDAIS